MLTKSRIALWSFFVSQDSISTAEHRGILYSLVSFSIITSREISMKPSPFFDRRVADLPSRKTSAEVMMPLLHHHDGPQAPWVLILVDAEDESF